MTGPILAGVVLLATNWPIWVDNLCSAIITAIILPAAVIAMTLLFYDPRHHSQSETQPPCRLHLPRTPTENRADAPTIDLRAW